jgi:hypothetical protein
MIIKAGSGFYFHAPRVYYVSFSRYVCACTCSSQTTNAAALNANEFPGRSALEHTRSRCTQCELLHNRIFCCRKLCAEIEPNLAQNVSLHCQNAERDFFYQTAAAILVAKQIFQSLWGKRGACMRLCLHLHKIWNGKVRMRIAIRLDFACWEIEDLTM